MGEAIMIHDIQRAAETLFGVSVLEQKSPRRIRHVTDVRQAAMAAAYMMTDKSLPQIGRAFGGRDHTTVLHAVNVARDRPHLAEMVAAMRAMLSEREKLEMR